MGIFTIENSMGYFQECKNTSHILYVLQKYFPISSSGLVFRLYFKYFIGKKIEKLFHVLIESSWKFKIHKRKFRAGKVR